MKKRKQQRRMLKALHTVWWLSILSWNGEEKTNAHSIRFPVAGNEHYREKNLLLLLLRVRVWVKLFHHFKFFTMVVVNLTLRSMVRWIWKVFFCIRNFAETKYALEQPNTHTLEIVKNERFVQSNVVVFPIFLSFVKLSSINVVVEAACRNIADVPIGIRSVLHTAIWHSLILQCRPV